jgi:exopolysaccharide biosynthesis predicted pyruvyltransferase EpsI/glycosyltransferase involved in cell wall biosynthesis
MTKVSVVMPVYNSGAHLRESIESVLAQTFNDFELLVINEFGSDENCTDIIREYTKKDNRIRLVQNETKLGLAESLNKGIKLSKGEYVARMDADDISLPERFEKQVNFLDQNKNISLCGTWQQYFGTLNNIHKAAETPEDLKAAFIFACDMCHSTVMLRRNDFVSSNLFYDGTKFSEDYELWVRATEKLNFANIPEVLGLYRHDGNNITQSKMVDLHRESAEITAQILTKLNIFIEQSDMDLLGGWINTFEPHDNELLNREKKLLDKIVAQNKKLKIYNQQSLLKALGKRWLWVNRIDSSSINTDINYLNLRKDNGIRKVVNKMPFKQKCKHAFKRVFRRIYRKAMDRVLNEFDMRLIPRIKDNLYEEISGAKEALIAEIGLAKEALGADIIGTKEVLCADINLAKEALSADIIGTKEALSADIIGTKEALSTDIIRAKEALCTDIGKANNLILSALGDDLKRIALYQHIRISGIDRAIKKIFLLGVPYHQNIGDQAQTYCLNKWCNKNYPDYAVYEIQSAYTDKFDFYPMLLLIREKLNDNDKIFIHSGYHTTDIYYNEQILTLAALNVFHKNQIIIFPQTVFFNDATKMQYVAETHNLHKNVIFMARESISHGYAEKMFTCARVIKFPDIVVSLIGDFATSEGFNREGILFCLRKCSANEKEYFDDDTLSALATKLKDTHMPIDFYDTSLEVPLCEIEANREHVLRKEIFNRFAKYRAIITNRYHGVIFSLVSNTPVIVLKSGVHNLSAGIEWFANLDVFKDYIYFCETTEQAEQALIKIHNAELEYNLPAYFKENYYDKLKNLIDETRLSE